MPPNSNPKSGKGKSKKGKNKKKLKKGLNYWERKYRKLLKKFPFIINNNNNNAAGGGGGGGSSSSSGRSGGGYAPSYVPVPYAPPYQATWSMQPPPPRKPSGGGSRRPPQPPPGPPPPSSLPPTPKPDHKPKPKPKARGDVVMSDYKPPPPDAPQGGVWIDASMLPRSGNASEPLFMTERSDKPGRPGGGGGVMVSASTGGPQRRAKLTGDDHDKFAVRPRPPTFTIQRPSTNVLDTVSSKPPPPGPGGSGARVRLSRNQPSSYRLVPNPGKLPGEVFITNPPPPPPPPPPALQIPSDMIITTDSKVGMKAKGRKPRRANISITPKERSRNTVFEKPQATNNDTIAFVPKDAKDPFAAKVPPAAALVTTPEASPTDVAQIIRATLEAYKKEEEDRKAAEAEARKAVAEEEARRATEDFMKDEERRAAEDALAAEENAIMADVDDPEQTIDDDRYDVLSMEAHQRQLDRELEAQDQAIDNEIIRSRIQRKKEKLARIRRAELQRRDWMVRASREARLNMLKRKLERADLRTREKQYMNRAVIPEVITDEVRPADDRYVKQLITEKKFPDEAEPNVTPFKLPYPNIPAFHPGVNVIPDDEY